jgi:Icc-related predicted phosphoesterase
VKILCVSDTVVQQLENAAHLRRRYHDIELIVSCGDMPSAYLEFITSVLNVPLFYVRGNHDEHYTQKPPGGENLHRRFLTYNGISFYGIEGSMRYNQGAIQYSNGEISRMVSLPGPRLMYRRCRYPRAVDIFVTHAPPLGIHDMPDLTHTGFKSFLKFMKLYRPRYMLHGHVHTWDRRSTVETQYLDTCIMNINPVTVLEIEPEPAGG